jgi:hypothetical protein
MSITAFFRRTNPTIGRQNTPARAIGEIIQSVLLCPDCQSVPVDGVCPKCGRWLKVAIDGLIHAWPDDTRQH